MKKNRLKLGLVANEFFDSTVASARFGGFGWAALQVARVFGDDPSLGVDVIFFPRATKGGKSNLEENVHGTRIISLADGGIEYYRRVWAENVDIFLCIDYRPSYERLLRANPRVPTVIWVRDPRTPEDASRLLTIRTPGELDVVPPTAESMDCRSFAKIGRYSKFFSRSLLFATPARYLAHKVQSSYGVEPKHVSILPNIIDIDLEEGEIRKSEKPSVIFLGRLDPYKRPWIYVELAKRFPDINFILCGQCHVSGPGSWKAENLPDNVTLAGHVDGEAKKQLLSSAWVLINTSMHEGLAVSFQEALFCKTPLLSSVDPQGIVTMFGIFTGYWEGTGLESLPIFERGLKRLLSDQELRKRLGEEGREWVRRTHNRDMFLGAFKEICLEAKVSMNGALSGIEAGGSIPCESVY